MSACQRAKESRDLPLVQNCICPRAIYSEETVATKPAIAPYAMIPIFNEDDIHVVVVDGETKGYWRMLGAKLCSGPISIDDWRSRNRDGCVPQTGCAPRVLETRSICRDGVKRSGRKL